MLNAAQRTAQQVAQRATERMAQLEQQIPAPPGMQAGLKTMQSAIDAVMDKATLPGWAEEYFNSCESYYSTVTTSLFPDRPMKFKNIFICSDMGYTKFYEHGVAHRLIENATAPDLGEIDIHTVIIGIGGMGKSMMIRHLFLDEIARRRRIPVLLSLVEYEGNDIVDAIVHEIEEMGVDTSTEEVDELLKNGRLVLFMDAFDEITERANQDAFAKKSSGFLKKYQSAPIIMSCRELGSNRTFHQFAQLHLLPFSSLQMISYVKKAGFSEAQQDEIFRLPIVRDIVEHSKDRDAIYKEMFERRMTEKAETTTPLILSMILIAYRSMGHVDDKSFYRDVFKTMVQKHDEGKEIPVDRPYETGLRL